MTMHVTVVFSTYIKFGILLCLEAKQNCPMCILARREGGKGRERSPNGLVARAFAKAHPVSRHPSPRGG